MNQLERGNGIGGPVLGLWRKSDQKTLFGNLGNYCRFFGGHFLSEFVECRRLDWLIP